MPSGWLISPTTANPSGSVTDDVPSQMRTAGGKFSMAVPPAAPPRAAAGIAPAGAQDHGPLVVAEGRVSTRYGVPVLTADRLERPLPATSPRPTRRRASHGPENNGEPLPITTHNGDES